MTSLPIGTSLGRYRIESLIGRGGMGVVYLAEQTSLKRVVALKVLAPELAETPGFRQRFERECELAASLDHPNIVPVFDAGEAEGMLYVAMRYVRGTDLRSVLGIEGRLNMDRALPVVSQVASALDAAHAAGLVHRDVKPANILIEEGTGSTSGDGTPRVYLGDFGLTKRVGSRSGITQTGQFLGTIDYVAPEQIKGETVDGRADQYSLACVLYQCLTGRPPFTLDAEVAVIYAHLAGEPPSLRATRPDLPQPLEDVLKRAMAKEPDERYPSCAAMAADAGRAAGPSGEAMPYPFPSSASGETAIAASPPQTVGAPYPVGVPSGASPVPPATSPEPPTRTASVGGPPPAEPARTAVVPAQPADPGVETAPMAPAAPGRGPQAPARRRRKPWLIPLMGVLAIAAIAGGVLALTRHHGDTGPSGTGGTNPSGGPSASAGPSSGGSLTLADYVDRIDGILARSSQDRQQLNEHVIPDASSGVPARMQNALSLVRQIVDSRRTLMAEVSAIQPPPGAKTANGLLGQALEAALSSDVLYRQWVKAEIAGNETGAHDLRQAAATNDRNLVDPLKLRFVHTYNPLRQQVGEPLLPQPPNF